MRASLAWSTIGFSAWAVLACGAGGTTEVRRASSGPLSCDEHCASIERSCGPRAPPGECGEYCQSWRAGIKDPEAPACRSASSDYFACRQALFIEMCDGGPHDVRRCNAQAEAATAACARSDAQ